MQRTQIYLDEEEAELLRAASSRTGASRSELIRRAIRREYGAHTAERRLAALKASAGAWADREVSGAEYVDTMRGDLDERLQHLGLT